jgi:hypothetical protein
MTKRYCLFLTKSEINKLRELVKENKKSKTPLRIRRRLDDLYIEANGIVVNGGGA